MGNKPSTPNKSPETEFKNFYDIIDYIATYYILTMDFKSLSKLSEKEYCDKLIILTSDIIDKYFNEHEITFLEQRVKDGVIVNSLSSEKILFIDKDKLNSLDMENDTKKNIQKNVKKNRVCIGIAKFYVKIAHIFAAIIMTINPVYTYTDIATGETMKTTLLEKDKIPKKSNRKLFKINICDNRIRALRKNEVVDDSTNNVTIEPEICDINSNTFGTTKTLQEEPGIPEFIQLYYDNYDENNGTFSGMSSESKTLFDKDLKLFYSAFTGEENMPSEVTKFSDIKLKDYSKNANCSKPDGKLRYKIKISQNDDLFVAYANNLKKMIKTAADNQSKLLSVINELFTYTNDFKTGKRIIKVNPNLTEALLQQCVEKTRKLLMDLYLNCENDYQEGVKIYSALVESKNAVIVPRQIQTLKDKSDKLIESIQIPMASDDVQSQPNVVFLSKEQPPNDEEKPIVQPIELNIESDNENPLEELMKFPMKIHTKPPEENPYKLPLKEEENPYKPPLKEEENPYKLPEKEEENPYKLPEKEEEPYKPPEENPYKSSEENPYKSSEEFMKKDEINPNNIKDTFELNNILKYDPSVNKDERRETGGKKNHKKTKKNKKTKVNKKSKKNNK